MRKLIYILLFICSFGYGQGIVNNPFVTFPVASCTPLADNHATTANATSDDNCNEANSYDGFTNGNANGTMNVDSAEPYEGDYCFKHIGLGAISYAKYDFAITNGSTYKVSFWAKSTVGTYARLTGWNNLTGGPSNVTLNSTWTYYEYIVTATTDGTGTLRFYSSANGGAAAGENIFVDKLSIIKLT